MNLTLLGLPGAGKGTQAKMISQEYRLPHIATGDIFRQLIEEETPLGKRAERFISAGELVPDQDAINIIRKALNETDINQGFILDGFPRTLYQAEILQEILADLNKEIDLVFYIEANEEELVKRVSERRVCLNCGASYHLSHNPPKEKDVCDNCGSELIQRSDDQEETVRHRIEKHSNQIKKLVKYYSDQGILKKVSGNSIDDIFSQIKETIEVKL